MKILHTADWHLGNTFHGHSREEEHRHFLSWLLAQIRAQQPDVLLLTGDVFDSPNPSAGAERMLYDFLLTATTGVAGLQIVVTAGNHDSGGRLEAPTALLHRLNVYVRGTVRYSEKGEPDFSHFLLPLSRRDSDEAACVCMALPYLRSCDYPPGYSPEQGMRYYLDEMVRRHRKSDFKRLPLILAAHFYAAGAEVCADEHSERIVVGGAECISTGVLPDCISYTALGHIHKAQCAAGSENAYYAGSALPMSFSETNYRHGIQLIEIDEEGTARIDRLVYTPLRRLLSIPSNGEAASQSEVFDRIAELPRRTKGDDGATWPYLEIRIQEQQPEPSLLHQIMEAVADKAVYLCRVVRVLPEQKASNPQAGKAEPSLRATEPLELARDYFEQRYHSEMSPALVARFKQAEEAAAHARSNPEA